MDLGAGMGILSCSVGLSFSVLRATWPATFLGVLGVMVNLACANMGIYSGYSDFVRLWPVRVGGLLLALTWYAVARKFHSKTYARIVLFSRTSLFRLALTFAAVAGAIGSALQFRAGIPLFQPQVDIARQFARENTNVFVGVLQQGWTIGLLLCLGAILLDRNRRGSLYVFLGYFALGSSLGGSRNALLSGVVPVGVAWLMKARLERSNVREHVKYSGWAKLAVFCLGAVLVLGAMIYSSHRILNGTGAFEVAFQSQVGPGIVSRLTHMLILTLTAPLETWTRIDLLMDVNTIPFEFQTMAWAGSLLERVGFSPSMNEIAASVSQPYYMNATTFAGPPLVDFGRVGVLVVAVAIGLVVGFLVREAKKSDDLPALLLFGYVVYVAFLGLYSFQPFSSVGPAVVALVLYGLHRQFDRTLYGRISTRDG